MRGARKPDPTQTNVGALSRRHPDRSYCRGPRRHGHTAPTPSPGPQRARLHPAVFTGELLQALLRIGGDVEGVDFGGRGGVFVGDGLVGDPGVGEGYPQAAVSEHCRDPFETHPAVDCLGGECVPQLVQGQRHGKPVDSQFLDQRVHHFGSDSRAKNAAARRRISFSCSSTRLRLRCFADLDRFVGGDTGTDAVFDVGEFQPAMQTRFGNPEVLRDLRQRRFPLASNRHDIATELHRDALGMTTSFQ